LADCRIERQQRIERRQLCGRPPIQYRLKSAPARNGAPCTAYPIHALGRDQQGASIAKAVNDSFADGEALVGRHRGIDCGQERKPSVFARRRAQRQIALDPQLDVRDVSRRAEHSQQKQPG
jgi:hypothetical protein